MFGDGSPNFKACQRLHESQEVQILFFSYFLMTRPMWFCSTIVIEDIYATPARTRSPSASVYQCAAWHILVPCVRVLCQALLPKLFTTQSPYPTLTSVWWTRCQMWLRISLRGSYVFYFIFCVGGGGWQNMLLRDHLRLIHSNWISLDWFKVSDIDPGIKWVKLSDYELQIITCDIFTFNVHDCHKWLAVKYEPQFSKYSTIMVGCIFEIYT
jgi:hypothetical protein